eukprot:TRINITY_DN11474_c0_g4_i1.p1 TRINITY_DN11474_c0_g4~~TRINITY_DN11474_c0_g4_i1.p1  ORF type:complete len:424 (+),score=53.57 TRINITY_DN11474_c0_g4_i1:57-1328(+)
MRRRETATPASGGADGATTNRAAGASSSGDQRAHSTVRVIASRILMLTPAILIGATYMQLEGWAMYSENDLLNAGVEHPIFQDDEHFHEQFWQRTMLQRERLASLTETLHGTARALERLGMRPFLESASLIGWMRHGGGQIPWDVDGDLGISVDDCRAAGAVRADLEAVIAPELLVLKFACQCEEDCSGDNLRMVGRVTNRKTGVCIDIFSYAPVKEARPWQKAASHKGDTEWWERVNDHADYTFPRETLFPLQNGTFDGSPILLPHDPEQFLSWEYGSCLGVHVWPWRLLLYTPMSAVSLAAVLMKGVSFLSGPKAGHSPDLALPAAIYALAVLTFFKNGVTVVLALITVICELCVVSLRPDLCGPQQRKRYRIAALITIAALVFDLRGSLGYTLCQIDDFYLHPRRPKSWTLCLLGKCWDF